ncbi:MAG TPA: aminoglycoside phosphotransferase family protein [Longimicrobiaceae bacterium]|nr:aminoglycoside phosphotransferase family protein [Longimicrobiaceae bacterium]
MGYGTDDGRVVRVPKHDEAERSLRMEACVLPRIAGSLPLPVPLPLILESSEAGSRPVAVHARIPGDELSREAWEGLAPEDRERLAAESAAFLRALHSLDFGPLLDCGVEVDDHADGVRDIQMRARAKLDALLPAETATRVHAAFDRYLAGALRTGRRALLHRDFGPSHVRFDPVTTRITGVIDFGDLAVGDPARDFMGIYEDWGPDFLAIVLRCYGLEAGEALMPRIRFHYLAGHVWWLLRMLENGAGGEELREGIDGLCREVEAG